MDCPDDDLLVALFEGRIGATERDAVEDHLDGCDACRVLVASVARAESGAAEEETPARACSCSQLSQAGWHSMETARTVRLHKPYLQR